MVGERFFATLAWVSHIFADNEHYASFVIMTEKHSFT